MGLFVLVLFVAVIFMIEGAYLLWRDYKGPDVQRLERRLRTLSAGRHGTEAMTLLKQRNLSDAPFLERILLRLPRIEAIDSWLQQSGVAMTVGRFLFVTVLVALVALVITLMFRMVFVAALVFVLLAAASPLLFLMRSRSKRLGKFDEQLPDALDLMSRALRAGHAFPSALQMVATEASDPIATEFQITFEEINYGISVNDAMLNLATRVPSIDLRYFIISVLVQRETGGNLSELLENLSHLIRERFKLLGRVRVLATEGRLSAYILVTLPFATAIVIYLVNPNFISLLWTDPAGLKLVWGALGMMLLGATWMWRIVKIRV